MTKAMGLVRTLGALLSVCVCALASPAPVEAAPGDRDSKGSPGGLPGGASEGWLSQVRRSIEAERYGAVREDGSESAFRAANPAHGFDSRFHGRGVMVRRESDTAAGRPAFEWGLSLRGWGRREALQDVPEGRLTVGGSRVELARGALMEWFVNTPEGLEHGFTLPGPPEEADGPLVLDLALEGGLRPVFAEDGQAIDFFDAGNIGVLRYAHLLVTDATGAKLPSRMEPIPGGIRIAVDDDRAVYPLLVDPLATSPAWTASGDEDFDLFGSTVATAGDVNGDGYADVLVGAWVHDGGGGSGANRGRVFLYLGSASGPGVSPAWTGSGDETSSGFGFQVATAGDVNGDGYSDVLVGAIWHDAGAALNSDRGRAYLYLGSASGLAGSPAWTGSGDESLAFFGRSVATAGDVNGDGYSDVIVGADGHNAGGLDRGRAYLYLGSAAGLAASAAWIGSGDENEALYGRSVAPAGDVNGDGFADVVVGAYQHDAGGGSGANRGRAYLYLGSASGLAVSPAWTGSGDENGAALGFSIATAGDVNGDGFADVVVGAYQHDAGGGDRGRAYLHLGSSSGLAVSPAWTGSGDENFARFGYSVATAGDINGDGYSDVVVSAPFHDAGAGFDANRGRAYVYFGSASGLAVSPAWTGSGDENVALYGGSVATAGDVNGDGYSDVVVGAEFHNGGTVSGDRGRVYVYVGSASGLAVGASWTGSGDENGAFFGYSAATAGDVNGDGYSDVVVGAYGHDIGLGVGANRGRAYLYLGSASGLAVSPAWTASGDETNASFGASVATAGDVNGDGYSDVLVGAALHDAGGGAGANRGRAYLYLGSASGLGANPAWTGTGDDDQAAFGGSLATAGDVNGDGYSEVVVGARYHDAGAGADTLRGRAYLYLGSASGLAVSPAWTVSGDEDYAEFGSSVATAGDVNGDGYADVIVGADRHDAGAGEETERGRAYLYLGSVSGLAVSPVWTGSGDEDGALFGASVATAGDVNGDGYADVAVGAFAHEAGLPLTDEVGRAYLYLGSAAGLAVSPAWTGSGDETDAHYGSAVATAGDVNGDGYADLLVAASTHDGGAGSGANRGRAYLYLGSASGLVVSPAWTISGDQNNAVFGGSLSTAGDVNGDGCADVVVAAAGHNAGGGASAFRGRVYNYLGCGGAGFLLRPRQLRADLSGPIAPGGRAHQQQFRLGLNLSSPVGVVSRALQWQIRSWGGSFSPALAPIQSDDTWHGTPQAVAKLLSLSVDGQRYIWRARARYHPGQSPFVGWSRWVTLSGNGLYEADLRSTSQAQPPPCVVPDEEIYIVNVTLDLNGNPVLHYMDPNQPSEVTGYNIYRSPSSTGPWTLIGSNVVDMDAGTANKQYVDPTGGGGATWFYEVAAVNAVCGAEGPW